MASMIAWHYTVGIHFPRIVEEGVLVPADPHAAFRIDLDPKMLAGMRALYGNEKPALWFSLRQDWEPTADKGDATSRADTLRIGRGLVRFGVDETRVPLTWTYHVNTSGLRKKGARALERGARAKGANPADWRVSYDAIPIAECIVERLNPDTGLWEPVPGK